MIPVFCSIIKPINKYSKHLVDSLLADKAVVILTDTVYGVLALKEEKIIDIKKRNKNKKTIRFISNIYEIDKDIPEDLLRILNKYWPGPLTIIYKDIGYRIPNSPIILEAIQKINKPVFASSANISNNPTVQSIEQAKEIFKDNLESVEFIDIGNSYKMRNIASTIYDYTNDKVLREGDIKANDIREQRMRKS